MPTLLLDTSVFRAGHMAFDTEREPSDPHPIKSFQIFGPQGCLLKDIHSGSWHFSHKSCVSSLEVSWVSICKHPPRVLQRAGLSRGLSCAHPRHLRPSAGLFLPKGHVDRNRPQASLRSSGSFTHWPRNISPCNVPVRVCVCVCVH